MTTYRHTQVGWLSAGLLLGVLLFTVAMAAVTHAIEAVLVVMAVFLLAAVLFTSLTIRVEDRTLTLRFGPGPIRRRFDLSEIVSARAVRNPWYYGWGIRWTPHGWLYNVSGLSAVEIKMRDGRQYRIGTDEPEALLDAIRKAPGATDWEDPSAASTGPRSPI